MGKANVGDVVLFFNNIDDLDDNYVFGEIIGIEEGEKRNTYIVKEDNGNVHYGCIYDHHIMTPDDYRLLWAKEIGNITDEISLLVQDLNEINDRVNSLDDRLNDRNARQLKLNK